MTRVRLIMKPIRALLVFLFLALWTAVAYAADSASTPTSQLATGAVALLLAVLTPIVLALGSLAAAKIKSATKLDLSRQIREASIQAIGYAEQIARKAAATGAAKLPGAAKLDLALAFLIPLAEAQGWPTWARDRAKDWIEAELGQYHKFDPIETSTTEAGK